MSKYFITYNRHKEILDMGPVSTKAQKSKYTTQTFGSETELIEFAQEKGLILEIE